MTAMQRHRQKLIYNLLDTLEYVANEVIKREDAVEMEGFIDMVSNTIIEFGEITPKMREYLEERGYGQRE